MAGAEAERGRAGPGASSFLAIITRLENWAQWQVLQDFVEQAAQLDEEDFKRLEPPPMPNEDKSFSAPATPHPGQAAVPSLPMGTRHSKRRPQFLQRSS